MSKVIADISMSLDGYVTARGVDQEHGLGIGGEAIHAWVLEEPRSPVDEAVLAHSFEKTGAVVMGRRLYDIVDGPNGWNDDIGYGHDQNQSAAPPCYVVTHEPPAQVRLASRFRFVTEGVADAIDQARATAGDKDVVVMGGANVIDQSLAERLVDELRIHLSPLVLGGGTRLFDLAAPTTLVQREVTESPRATHLTYEVVRDYETAHPGAPPQADTSTTESGSTSRRSVMPSLFASRARVATEGSWSPASSRATAGCFSPSWRASAVCVSPCSTRYRMIKIAS